MGVMLGFLLPLLQGDQGVRPLEAIALIFVWVLPVLLLWIYAKVTRWRNVRCAGEIPKEQCESRLTTAGWAVGNPDAVTLFHWHDIQAIFDSDYFFGFKTINQLLHILPKRIFTEPGEAEKFLSQAVDLKQRAERDSEVPVATVVESGNPYQSPTN